MLPQYSPGTSAYDQVADVEFLQSNVALLMQCQN